MLRLLCLTVGLRFTPTLSFAPRARCATRKTGCIAGWMLGMVLLSGCDIPERVPLVPPADQYRSADEAGVGEPGRGAAASSGEQVARDDAKPEDRKYRGDFEAWDAYFVGDKHVGYSHITVAAHDDADRRDTKQPHVELNIEDCLLIHRGPASAFVQRHSHQSSETVDGQLQHYKSHLSVGPVITTCEGTVDEAALSVVKSRGAAVTTHRLSWSDQHRGLMAVEESIRRSPLSIGQKRTFQTLAPVQPLVTTVRLHCVARATVPLIDGKPHELLEIDVETDLGENRKNYHVIWAEPDGTIRRALYPASNLVTYRTDEKVAVKDIESQQDAIAIASTLTRSTLERPSETKRVGFKLVRTASPLAAEKSIIQPQPNQFVRNLDDTSVLVLVSRLGEAPKNGFEQGSFAVTDSDRKPNAIIDSSETMVRRIAQAAGGSGKLGESELAIELARSANRLTQLNPASGAFQRASEVARTAQGDATAYAVLLAALLRAKQIPSRVAFGFRYQATPTPRMVYHAWTLAHVDGDWLSLDATTGGIAAADRLTVSTSNLSHHDIGTAMMPVLDFLGACEIEIVASATRY
ncbi:Transglutaminase-like protein [Rhodopirellula maiorica SM1]|uniref:Transglutaminase-like protein n=1 Tax=Rhodopirellula maiorica SM1 TaxID=1265738 RepID=M5RES4_9BACT|nr:transglutaminase domain-containing protein [Rhodopirellula maiorica]EMI17865.1 Transglutaminase-like protein [Rhodopirellula maiorica SM1]